jgi:hypothetical protein
MAVAALFAFAAVCLFASNVYVVSNSMTVQGSVIDNREEISKGRFGDHQVTYYVVVKYNDAAGISHEAESERSVSDPVAIGTPTPVYTSLKNPSAARVGGDAFWDPPLGCLAVALVFLAWGTALIVVTRWVEHRWPGLAKRH